MQAAEPPQILVVQRLHAERHAVDAGGAIAAEALGLDAGRIGLQRHLDIGSTVHAAAMASRMAPTVAGCISDGVPPPKKIERDTAPRRQRRLRRDLAPEGRDEARLVDGAVPHMAVEIAIGAFEAQNGQCT